jgi:hypothetical protein
VKYEMMEEREFGNEKFTVGRNLILKYYDVKIIDAKLKLCILKLSKIKIFFLEFIVSVIE